MCRVLPFMVLVKERGKKRKCIHICTQEVQTTSLVEYTKTGHRGYFQGGGQVGGNEGNGS